MNSTPSFTPDWSAVARLVLTARAIDDLEEKELTPAGRVAYQFSSRGHDLAQVLLGLQLTHPHDAAAVYYRSRAFMLAAGLTVQEAFAADMARTGSPSEGRDVGVVFSLAPRRGVTVLPSSGDVGAQYTPACGWAQAGGEMLAYLAADDYLLPGAVRQAVECLERHPDAVLCYCDFLVVGPASRVIRKVTAPEYDYRDMAVRFVCAPGPGAFLRRSAFERAGPWNERLRQVPDYELWLRLGAEGRFCRIPQVLAAYRAHDRSQSYAPVSPERAAEPLQVIEEYFRPGRAPRELLGARNEALSNAGILAARLHLRSGRIAAGLRLLWGALRLHPGNFLRPGTWWRIASGLAGPLAHRTLWRLGT